jgi:hypothetical protein
MANLRAYAREAAARLAIDADIFERQIDQESGFNPDAHNAGSGADGIAQIVPKWHPAMAGKTRDPLASLDYAASLMAGYLGQYQGDWALALSCYNAGSGNTANGIAGTLDGWPYAETVAYVANILNLSAAEASRRLTKGRPSVPPAVTYNPDAVVDLQQDDWSCSVQSAQWLLRSLGRNPGDAWLEQQLVGPLYPGSIVTREHGLMDSSGKTLAAWMQREYGDEMGLTFEAKQNVTWEQVVALAGKQPIMLGGRTYNHWTGVRHMANGGLELANPAPNWKGVGSVMDQDEFAALGSWSLITAAVPAPGVGTGPAAGSDDDTILGLRRAVAHLCDVVLPRAAAAASLRDDALAEGRRIRAEFVGPPPAA